MRGCGRLEIISGLFACGVGPGSCFLHCSTTGIVRTARTAIRSSTMEAHPGADINHPDLRPEHLDQDATPLVDALAKAAGNVRSPLFYPGHKMGRYDSCGHDTVGETRSRGRACFFIISSERYA